MLGKAVGDIVGGDPWWFPIVNPLEQLWRHWMTGDPWPWTNVYARYDQPPQGDEPDWLAIAYQRVGLMADPSLSRAAQVTALIDHIDATGWVYEPQD